MKKQFGIILTSSLALLMINLDITAVNIVVPALMREFSVSFDRISVVVMAYLLGMVGTTLLFGKLADRKGHGKIFTGGYLLFLLGSILCAFSWDLLSLTVFRFVQGMGGAMILATSAAIVIRFLPTNIHGRAFGISGMMAGLGFALGSPLGGYLSTLFGWRSIFLINIPVSILGVILCFSYLRKEKLKAISHRFDKFGAVISFLFLTSIVLLIEVQQSTVNTIGVTAFAILLFILFFRRGKLHPDPILDFKLFKSKSFTASIFAMSCYYIILMGNAFVLPFFLMNGKKLSFAESGNFLFIAPIVCLIVSPFAGHLCDKFSSRVIAAIGVLLFVFSSLLFFNLPSVGTAAMIVSFIIYGLGLSLFVTPILSLIMGHTEGHNAGAVSSIKAVIPNLFGMIGVGVYASFYSSFYWSSAGQLTEVNASGAAFSSVMVITLIVSIVCAGLLIWIKDYRRL